MHIIAHLPFIGRRSNEGACVEQAPFALYSKSDFIFRKEKVKCLMIGYGKLFESGIKDKT